MPVLRQAYMPFPGECREITQIPTQSFNSGQAIASMTSVWPAPLLPPPQSRSLGRLPDPVFHPEAAIPPAMRPPHPAPAPLGRSFLTARAPDRSFAPQRASLGAHPDRFEIPIRSRRYVESIDGRVEPMIHRAICLNYKKTNSVNFKSDIFHYS